MKRPPSILHTNYLTTDDRPFLVQRVIDNFGLKSEEAELLRYYAKQSSGMAPSKKALAAIAAIKNAARARAKLEHDHIIGLINNRIILDWDHIRILASLPKAAIGKKGTHYIAPVVLDTKAEAERKLRDNKVWTDLMIRPPFETAV